jgi:hypothetical protein
LIQCHHKQPASAQTHITHLHCDILICDLRDQPLLRPRHHRLMEPALDEVLPPDHPWFAPVRQLLRGWTLAAYLATRPPTSVVTLPASATCAHALRVLAAHDILSAPVFDGKTYTGFVDVAEILRALLAIVGVRELNAENAQYRLRTAGVCGGGMCMCVCVCTVCMCACALSHTHTHSRRTAPCCCSTPLSSTRA